MFTFHLVKLAVILWISQIAPLSFQEVSFILVKPPSSHATWDISLMFFSFYVLICNMGLRVFTMQDCGDD